MTKDKALRLALEALLRSKRAVSEDLDLAGCAYGSVDPDGHRYTDAKMALSTLKQAITAIKAALEAKDEKANDELRRLHDLLGKANALARIRANKIDELEQRLTKTEAQLGEAVWNYGELKREQLANQQKTSGSPINTSTALEAKDEPVAWKWHQAPAKTQWGHEMVVADIAIDKDHTASIYCEHDQTAKVEAIFSTPPQRTWVGLTDEHKDGLICMTDPNPEPHHLRELIDVVEFQLKGKNT